MERKVLLTSIFITLGATAFLSGYLLMPEWHSKNQTGSLVERFNNNIEIEVPEDRAPKTLPVSSRKFISFVNPYSNSKKIVGVDKNASIIELDTDDLRETVLATLKHGSLSEGFLSPDGNSLIYSFYDTKNDKKYFYFNFKKGGSVEMDSNTRSLAFSPNGDQVALLTNNGSEGELLILKKTNVIKKVMKTRFNNALINWPSDFLSIVSYDKNGYGDLFILKEGGGFNKIISYQRDLNVKWSPSAKKIIFSAKDETNSDHLFYKDIKSKDTVTLEISTNTSKCIWVNEESIICGLKNQAQFKDEFYKINLTDRSKTLVATPSINLLTKELALSRSGDYIFVLNDIDSMLYALKLSN